MENLRIAKEEVTCLNKTKTVTKTKISKTIKINTISYVPMLNFPEKIQ